MTASRTPRKSATLTCATGGTPAATIEMRTATRAIRTSMRRYQRCRTGDRMAAFTKSQLADQLVLIRQFYARTLSRADFDAQMSDLKAEQGAVNAIRQRMLDARRKVDVWIGGEFQKTSYAGVGSSCQTAGVKAAKSGGDYTKAFNARWKELTEPIKAETKAKRKELKSCETTEAVAKLSAAWGGPQIESEKAKQPKKAPSTSVAEEGIEIDTLDITFIRKSNGWYHPVDESEHGKLAAAGFIRSRGSALVIAPDGRLKAWRVDDKLRSEKVLNGQQRHPDSKL